jgi:hypothetical protein
MVTRRLVSVTARDSDAQDDAMTSAHTWLAKRSVSVGEEEVDGTGSPQRLCRWAFAERNPGFWVVKNEEKWEHPTSPKMKRKVVSYCTATTLSLLVARSS